MTSGMQITINGAAEDVADRTTVATLVADHAERRTRVAVAVNAEVVPRSRWETTQLEAGDSVELLAATAGG